MEIRGQRVFEDAGPWTKTLLGKGFDAYLRRGTMEPPQVDPDTGTVFVTVVQLLLIPTRAPALTLREPIEAMVWSNVPAQMWEAEDRAGDENLLHTYSEKLCETAWEMLRERAPGVTR